MPAKITEWAEKGTGEFKRQASSFREEIKTGGKFAPDKGELAALQCNASIWLLEYRWRQREGAVTA